MVTRLSGGITPADGSDPRTFPTIWNATAGTIESQGSAITTAESDIDALEAKNIPAFGTAVATDLQVLSFGTAASEYAPVTLDLDYLSDVTVGTAVSDGQVLAYSTAVSGWVNEDPSGGAVLQVVSTTKTDTFTTTSESFTDVTGLSVSITPSSTSSKILVQYHVVSSMTTANWGGFGRLMRDSTPIGIADAASNRVRASTGFYIASNNQMALPTSGAELDSPNTTSAVTYKFQIATQAAAITATVNRSGADTDNNDTPRMVSSITAMEIAG